MRTTTGLALLSIGSALLLSGCASLPTSSVPKPLDKVEVSAPADYVISPASPDDGASPQTIVSGFLRAGVGVSDNYAVARSYLVSGFAAKWQPDTDTTVLAADPTVTCQSTSACVAVFDQAGSVTTNGEYSNATGRRQIELSLKRESGQWRISDAPDGTFVVRTDFEKAFRMRPVYFVASDGRHLAPDVRWFPNSVNTPTKLVQALLAGPSNWLAPAVKSALPGGTKLAVDSVTVVDGNTQVALGAEALESNSQPLMKAQLEATLLGVNGIKHVNMMVNNVGINADSSAAKVVNSSQRIALATLLAGDSGVSVLDADSSMSSASAQPLNITGVTSLARSGARTAYSTASGLYVANGQTTTELAKGKFSNVTIDTYGLIWAREGTKAVVFSGSERKDVSGLPNIAAISVAADGTRVAYITTDNKVQMAAIERATASISVTKPHTLTTLSGAGVGVAWSSAGSLVVASKDGDHDAVRGLGFNGVVTEFSNPGHVADVVAGNSSDSVRLRTIGGAALTLRGTGWVTSAEDVRGIGLVLN